MVLRWSGHGGRSVGRLRLPGGAVFDQPVNLSRLMARYVLTGLIALVIIAVFTAWASRSLGTKSAIDSANRRATLTAHAAVEPMLDNGIITGDPPVDEPARPHRPRPGPPRIPDPGQDLGHRRHDPLLGREPAHRTEVRAAGG